MYDSKRGQQQDAQIQIKSVSTSHRRTLANRQAASSRSAFALSREGSDDEVAEDVKQRQEKNRIVKAQENGYSRHINNKIQNRILPIHAIIE